MASDVRFNELRKRLEKHGWILVRVTGSHHIFTGPNRPTVSIPVHKGKVKAVYRRMVEKAIREQEAGQEEGGA